MARFIAGFVAGLLAALMIAFPVNSGSRNCHPAWKCSSAAPTLVQTPTPTVALTVPPTPAPTVNHYLVPASIDNTGSSDVSAALWAWFGTVPDGGYIDFRDGTYRLDQDRRLIGRKGLTFDGHGRTTLLSTQTSGQPRSSLFEIEGGSGITITGLILVGVNPDAGTVNAHHLAAQDQGGIDAYGVAGLVIDNVTVQGVYGDCVYLGINAGTWIDGVTIRSLTCKLNGRMGVAVVGARNVAVTGSSFDRLAMFVFDIEPDTSTGGATNVLFDSNSVGTYGLSNLFTEYFFAASGADGSLVDGVTVSRNTVTDAKGLRSTVGQGGNPNRVRKNVAVTDNTATVQRAGPVMDFHYVQGVTVTGNVQPLSSGVLATFEMCTGIVQ